MSAAHIGSHRDPVAWVLNLDAEHELEAGERYVPTRRVLDIVARQRERLIGTLVQPGDVVLGMHATEQVRPGMRGVAWCPSPSAVAQLTVAGAVVDRTPSLDVLCRVNARPFTVPVRDPHRGESFAKRAAHDLETLLAWLAHAPGRGGLHGGSWLVRRSFGTAGRGRRRIACGRPSTADLAWLVASLRIGPVVVEPWVSVTREYTRSGFVGEGGSVSIAAPCFQATTHGAWTFSEQAERAAISREDDARLEQAAEAAGRALADAGYFGPFGVDAFHYRPDPGSTREVLNSMSEINARFTMDWAEGRSGLRVASTPG